MAKTSTMRSSRRFAQLGSGRVFSPQPAANPKNGEFAPSTLNWPRTGGAGSVEGPAEFLKQTPIASPLPPNVLPNYGMTAKSFRRWPSNSNRSVFIVPAPRTTRLARTIPFHFSRRSR